MTLSITTQAMADAYNSFGSYAAAAKELGICPSALRMRLKANPEIRAEVPDYAFIPDATTLPGTHVGEHGVDTLDRWADHETGVTERYILTSAQNNVKVHEGFLRNLKALSKYLAAEIMVSYSVYDKAGYRGLQGGGDRTRPKREVWWDKAVSPYTVNTRVRLAKRLAFCGELDILATAANPLSGLDAYCGRSSLIIPHNRFAFRCVESRPTQMPKEMHTTGSVTVSSFIQRKTGQLAHFHHVLGALLVEVTAEGYFHVHHLNAEDDGSFYWLDKRVQDGKVRKSKHFIEGLVLGDIHHEKIDDEQNDIAFDLVKHFKPKHVMVHDIIDFTSRNHHNIKDPLFRVRKQGVLVEAEMRATRKWLTKLCKINPDHTQVAIVKSNHDTALTTWIKTTDWKDDPDNARFYLDLAYHMVTAAEDAMPFDPLKYVLRDPDRPRFVARFLRLDESYEVAGVECGMHGHIGPSGTRGMPAGYSRLGFKTFTAHTHTPSIVGGCYTVGVTGSLKMGYNVGPSKWMHCHGIIYPNGKRAFIFVKNKRWRA